MLRHTDVAVLRSIGNALCTNIFKAAIINEIPGEELRHA